MECGRLGISHNGYNGPYETAITADGQIVADFITSGSLVANIIKAGVIQSQDGSSWWDLESGEVVLHAYATNKQVTEVSDRITTIEEQKMLRLVITSSNGNIFKNGNVKTLLSAVVYSWDKDITTRWMPTSLSGQGCPKMPKRTRSGMSSISAVRKPWSSQVRMSKSALLFTAISSTPPLGRACYNGGIFYGNRRTHNRNRHSARF